VLIINEGNMTAAFWDFLKSIIGEKAYTVPEKKPTIAVLREYLAKLKS
jgi:hypothetical protein